MTIQHLIDLFKEYDEYLERGYGCEVKELSRLNYLSHKVEDAVMREHLRWLCHETIAMLTTPERFDLKAIMEAMRWLGYVQGELRAMQEFSVNQLREWSREDK